MNFFLEFSYMHKNKTYFCMLKIKKLFRIFGFFLNLREK